MKLSAAKQLLSDVYRYSLTRLSLNYYNFFEIVAEKQDLQKDASPFIDELNQFVELFLSGRQTDLQPLYLFRSRNMKKMESLLFYMEISAIYEYILDHLERKVSAKPQVNTSDRELSEMIVEFLKNAEGADEINHRIQLILQLLPVRLTRQTFFETVKKGLLRFAGSEKGNVMQTLSSLHFEKLFSDFAPISMEYKDFTAIWEELKVLDYKAPDKKRITLLSDKVFTAGQRLVEDSAIYMVVQELANDLILLFLTAGELQVEERQDQAAGFIMSEIFMKFQNSDYDDISDEMDRQLILLEGRQEYFYERFQRTDFSEQVDYDDGAGKKLELAGRLLSTSAFIDLEEKDSEEEKEEADYVWIEQYCSDFISELGVLLASLPKPQIRAVMAAVIAALPVSFGNYEEFNQYVLGRLSACTDMYERDACVESLINLMEQEYALV